MLPLWARCTVTWMRVYLDDERTPPDGWTLVRWPNEAIELLTIGEVTHLSLDHDLGADDTGTGYDAVLWIEEQVAMTGLVLPEIIVHSAKLSAREKMELGIESINRIVGNRGA